MSDILRFVKRIKTRVLRTYQRVAQKSHMCSQCQGEIFPGDWYEGEVKVYGKILFVSKYHLPDCPRDYYDDLEREFQEEIEKQEQLSGDALNKKKTA